VSTGSAFKSRMSGQNWDKIIKGESASLRSLDVRPVAIPHGNGITDSLPSLFTA